MDADTRRPGVPVQQLPNQLGTCSGEADHRCISVIVAASNLLKPADDIQVRLSLPACSSHPPRETEGSCIHHDGHSQLLALRTTGARYDLAAKWKPPNLPWALIPR